MNRRNFIATLAAGLALDPERLLWRPGAKLISIPKSGVKIGMPLTVRRPTRFIVTHVTSSSEYFPHMVPMPDGWSDFVENAFRVGDEFTLERPALYNRACAPSVSSS